MTFVAVSMILTDPHSPAPSETSQTTTMAPIVTNLAVSSSPTTPSSSTSTMPTASTATLPPPPTPTADGVRLVNYLNGTVEGSGFAYYASAINGNKGAQPDDFATLAVGRYAQWEDSNRSSRSKCCWQCARSWRIVAGVFTTTNTPFWVVVNTTGAPVNAPVGEASNGFRSFTAYKDDGRHLFNENGSDFSSEFYCQWRPDDQFRKSRDFWMLTMYDGIYVVERTVSTSARYPC